MLTCLRGHGGGSSLGLQGQAEDQRQGKLRLEIRSFLILRVFQHWHRLPEKPGLCIPGSCPKQVRQAVGGDGSSRARTRQLHEVPSSLTSLLVKQALRFGRFQQS